MIDKSGIRSLFAIDNLPEEVEEENKARAEVMACLLYTSDAADE